MARQLKGNLSGDALLFRFGKRAVWVYIPNLISTRCGCCFWWCHVTSPLCCTNLCTKVILLCAAETRVRSFLSTYLPDAGKRCERAPVPTGGWEQMLSGGAPAQAGAVLAAEKTARKERK